MMLGISYENWKKTCDSYFSVKPWRQKAYLQWYPFSQHFTKEVIGSKKFFEDYIKTGYCFFSDSVILKTNNYMQKKDGSYRNSQLVSPVIFLIIQCIANIISDLYIEKRPENMSIYYSGNLKRNRVFYKKDYGLFFNETLGVSKEYQYYFKTDISNFFRDINLNKLFDMISKNINADNIKLSETDILTYKNIFNYFGDFGYPVLENSVGTSYIATIVYLDSLDTSLYKYLKEQDFILNFKVIRYVDDLYVFFNSSKDYLGLINNYQEFLNFLTTHLDPLGLILKKDKCNFSYSTDISSDLKQSFYGDAQESFNADLSDLKDSVFINFLERLVNLKKFNEGINNIQYYDLVDECFSFDNIDADPNEVYNYFIYNRKFLFRNQSVIQLITEYADNTSISVDVKRITTMILNTKDGTIIKNLLNQLFSSDRYKIWYKSDTDIGLTYLMQRNFRHPHLLSIMKKEQPQIHQYYESFCSQDNWSNCCSYNYSISCSLNINTTNKTVLLYFLYLVNLGSNDYFSAYAYFKNYFDRFSAELAFVYDHKKDKKPNYNNYYKEGNLIGLYKNVENSEILIKKAHKIRNTSPVSHGSAELLDNKNSIADILAVIADLKALLKDYYLSNVQD